MLILKSNSTCSLLKAPASMWRSCLIAKRGSIKIGAVYYTVKICSRCAEEVYGDFTDDGNVTVTHLYKD